MSDPERWTNDPDAPEGVASLFLAGKKTTTPMPPEVRARVGTTIAALAAGGVASASSTAAAAKVASTTIASSGLFKITMVAVVLSVTSATVFHFTGPSETTHPPRAAVVATAPIEATATPVEATAPAPIEAVVPEPLAASIASPMARPVPRPSTPTDALDPLAEEARLISEAHAVLEAQPARALALTTTHRRLYAEGQLAAERELVAIDALMRLGRADAARARAARLDAQYPSTPYPARAQRILARGAETDAE